MGGGEGSAAREALRHNSIEKVVMCDIDQVISIVHSPPRSLSAVDLDDSRNSDTCYDLVDYRRWLISAVDILQ